MTDIQNRDDLATLINAFYSKVLKDPVIGHFFTETDFSLEAHLPVMISFWETVLFHTPSYSGNPMVKHLVLNQLFPMEALHFERWLGIWEQTVYANFNGPVAEDAVFRGKSIAKIMEGRVKMG